MRSVCPSSLTDFHWTTKLACTWYHGVSLCVCVCIIIINQLMLLRVTDVWFVCVCENVYSARVCMRACVCVCGWGCLWYTPSTDPPGPSPNPLLSPSQIHSPAHPCLFLLSNLISSFGWTSLESLLTVTMVTNEDTCHCNLIKCFAPTVCVCVHIYRCVYTCFTLTQQLRYQRETHRNTKTHSKEQMCVSTWWPPSSLQEL